MDIVFLMSVVYVCLFLDEDEWVLASENFPETLSKDDQESPNRCAEF